MEKALRLPMSLLPLPLVVQTYSYGDKISTFPVA